MMKSWKNAAILVVVLIFALNLFGCGGGAPAGEQETETPVSSAEPMKLVASHVLGPTHPYQPGFERMAEIVEERTNGEIVIEIFHSASLAEEEEAIEALQIGTIDITTVSAAPMTGFVKEYMASDLPFIFANPEDAFAFYDGEVGDKLFELTEPIGLVGLAWWENGFRNFTTKNTPIHTPSDMRGLKMRTMSSPVHMASIRALGGNAVPIPFGELYSALQQGVVDGQENPVANIHAMRFNEVQEYVILSRHFHDPSPLFISQLTWDKLNDEQKQIIQEAAIEARDYMRQVGIDQEAGLIEELRASGTEIIELTPEEVRMFQEATKDVYKEFEDQIGEEYMQFFFDHLNR
ncbi:MAG: DctP family TRAP transporter solute-binding subunit [Bacillota bacterium]|nr:DctP family TRAP transporter solute-binding subunit [Bacillota bacterium]